MKSNHSYWITVFLLVLSVMSGWVGSQSIQVKVNGICCPFLAGQKNGTRHTYGDVAPYQSPVLVMLPISSMGTLQFLNVTGTAANNPINPFYPPEGDPVSLATPSAALGISGYRNPYMSLVGVFLPGTVNPNPQSPPPNIDFDTSAKRDFVELKPMLYQVFFIGDGLRNNKTTVQKFVVPGGATRLFLGTCDAYEWNNNAGAFNCTVRGATYIQGTGTTRPGGKVSLALTAPSDVGLPYQVGSSLGIGPIQFGARQIGLSPDSLLVASLQGFWPAVFSGYVGVIDSQGQAKGVINIPSFPLLIGNTIHTAFVTLSPSSPSGIKSISNTYSFKIQ